MPPPPPDRLRRSPSLAIAPPLRMRSGHRGRPDLGADRQRQRRPRTDHRRRRMHPPAPRSTRPATSWSAPTSLYVYNPNFGAGRRLHPRAGSAGSQRAAARRRRLPLAEPDQRAEHRRLGRRSSTTTLTALKNAAFDDSEMVPDLRRRGLLRRRSGRSASPQVFQGLVLDRRRVAGFFEPGDATEIVAVGHRRRSA